MADLLHILPSFPTSSHSHLLPSLEKCLITTTDLITIDAIEIAKRAHLPVHDVRGLANAITTALKVDLSIEDQNVEIGDEGLKNRTDGVKLRRSGTELVERWSTISTLDERLDAALGGGIPTGYITEITGESGAGKTQLLLTLLLSAQLPAPHGLERPALYISTEAPLSTTRLSQLLNKHPHLASLPASQKPSLDAVLSITVPDLESQDHILRYQVPVSVHRHKIGLVIIDSVAANYRAEFEARAGGTAMMARRSAELIRLGGLLRDLARTEDVAVVVANQVADRFMPASSTHEHGILSLDYQQRWFTGWGDISPNQDQNLKTPSLGHAWTLQLSARIALLKEPIYHDNHNLDKSASENKDDDNEVVQQTWKRTFKVVFAPWVGGGDDGNGGGVEFVISAEGIKGLVKSRTIE